MCSTVFSDIYMRNTWGPPGEGSGPGSSVAFNADLIDFLRDFIILRGVESVADLGCGDFRYGRVLFTEKVHVRYHGYDIYESVIPRCTVSHLKFSTLDFYQDFDKVEPADLCIIKDVLQHWPRRMISSFLANLNQKFKYVIVINCCTGANESADIQLGQFRQLTCDHEPLKSAGFMRMMVYNGKEVSVKFV